VDETLTPDAVLTAGDVMTHPCVTIPARTPLRAAAALLAAHGFTGAPVVGANGELLGVVTEADLVRSRAGGALSELSEQTARVEDVMTAPALVRRASDELTEVVALMLEAGIRSVPIVEAGRPVGMVSRRDVLRLIARGEYDPSEVRHRRGLP
jgi:CBS domain-containing protein